MLLPFPTCFNIYSNVFLCDACHIVARLGFVFSFYAFTWHTHTLTHTHIHTRAGWTLHLQLRCRWLRRVLLTFNYSIFRGFVRLYFVVVIVVVELLLWGLKIPFIVCTLQTVVHVIADSPLSPHQPISLGVHLMGIMNSSLTSACISSTNPKSSCHVLCQAPKMKRKHLHRTFINTSYMFVRSNTREESISISIRPKITDYKKNNNKWNIVFISR